MSYRATGRAEPAIDLAARKVVGTRADPIAKFGKRMSAFIMRKIQSVPRDRRTPVLMATLDAIDPRLFSIIDQKARRFQAQKGYSDTEALRRALSAAFSNQLVFDFITTGKTRTVPLDSMLGLGQYGPVAKDRALRRYTDNLGALSGVMVTAAVNLAQATTGTAITTTGAASCPAGQVYAPHWERARAGSPGDACVMEQNGSRKLTMPIGPGKCPPGYTYSQTWRRVDGCVEKTADDTVYADADGNCPPGYRKTRTDACKWVADTSGKCDPGFVWNGTACVPYVHKPRTLSVGPFMFYADLETDRAAAYHKQVPGQWSTYFAERLGEIYGAVSTKSMPMGVVAQTIGLDRWLSPRYHDLVVDKRFFDGEKPIARFKHPKTGKPFGLFLVSTKTYFTAEIKPAPKDKPWYAKLWNALKWLGAKIIEFAEEVIDKVADLVCDVATNPIGQVAAGGAAVYAGADADAAVMGTMVAASACAKPAPPMPPFLPPGGLPGWVLPAAALAGGGLLLALALKKRKKR